MKRIILATSLGVGLLSFVMASSTNVHATAPYSVQTVTDTVLTDSSQPAPKDTTKIVSNFNQ